MLRLPMVKAEVVWNCELLGSSPLTANGVIWSEATELGSNMSGILSFHLSKFRSSLFSVDDATEGEL